MRVCKKCQIEKEESKFDLHRYTCQSCRYKSLRQRKIENGLLPKQRKKRVKQFVEQIKQKRKEYYQKNKDYILQARKKYCEENPDKIADAAKQYRQKNIVNRREYDRKYRLEHKEKRRIQNRESERRRMKNEPSFKLRKNLRNAIYCALIRNQSCKNNLSILKYLPYTMDELKQHLESKFESWMVWENWGIYNPETWNDQDPTTWTWQLDHINLQSYFPYSSMEEDNFKKCWALENLRPLSAKQNCMENTIRSRNVLSVL